LAVPGARVLLDAHNCYPYEGKWTNRLDRALATGTPIAIEQDLIWFTDRRTGVPRSVVAHAAEEAATGSSLRDHFFERIRPVVERALAANRRDDWPLIVLNLDLKSNEPAHHEAIWTTLGEYEAWLTTARRTDAAETPAPLEVGPILVLTGSHDGQEASFHDSVPIGRRLRVFGAIGTPQPPEDSTDEAKAQFLLAQSADQLIARRASNYRRWVNFPWAVVELGGPRHAGAWTNDDVTRLRALVDRAHANGLWIRFYTLNGHAPEVGASEGWTESYNFGALEAVRARWQAALDAGVDFVATDQYEAFAALLQPRRRRGAERSG
jgi:glycerophosphoryl diester phosphodiesterase